MPARTPGSKTLNVVVPPEMAEQLTTIARLEDRSMTNLVLRVLRLWLEDRDVEARLNG